MIEHRFACTKTIFLGLYQKFLDQDHSALLLSDTQDQPSYLFLFASDISDPRVEVNPWDQLKSDLHFSKTASLTPRYVGYLSYEMGAFSDPGYRPSIPQLPIPLTSFFKASVVCRWINTTLTISIFDEAENLSILLRAYWEELIRSLTSFQTVFQDMQLLSESDDLNSYLDKIDKAKNYIHEGDIYQVNLSRSAIYQTSCSGFDIFLKLIENNQNPFSAYLKMPGYEILSISPERFLKFDGNTLETCPIKGTIRRGQNSFDDQILLKTLLQSEKENAELMMICDLMRNDLGKIAQIGSVHCPALKNILKLSNVFHLYSVVRASPLDIHPVDMIRSCFPAGSITGCPKIRAMQIIQEIEQRPRHIYCGAIGYFTGQGTFDFNVSIRTALLKNRHLEMQTGGAITIDSDPYSEFEETFYKGNPFMQISQEIKKTRFAYTHQTLEDLTSSIDLHCRV